MYAFSAKIEVGPGATLAGWGDRMDVPTTEAGCLEVHGIGAEGDWQVCSIDALYAGVLAQSPAAERRVLAASHTHYVPLLDPAKSALGHFSPAVVRRFETALREARRIPIAPDSCALFRAEVDVPVYRRFDYPATTFNSLLSHHCGLFPNPAHPVDRNVYILVFAQGELPLFSIAYHACHPLTRRDGRAASSDYVGALRTAISERFGTTTCLFFLGCAGDVRPNFAGKRIELLPRNRLNWSFKEPTLEDEQSTDAKYADAVQRAEFVARFVATEADFRVAERVLEVRGLGGVPMQQLDIADQLSFAFLPFEVSHRYQLETLNVSDRPRRFIVSCSGDVRGYLPHADQHRHGGYEVDGSLPLMGLKNRISVESRDIWPPK